MGRSLAAAPGSLSCKEEIATVITGLSQASQAREEKQDEGENSNCQVSKTAAKTALKSG